MAAMRAVLETEDSIALAGAVSRARGRWGEAVLAPLLAVLDPAAEARVRAAAAAVDHSYRSPSPELVLARIAAGFDRAAAVSPDAGAALYSLGDPGLLAQATAEVVAWLRGHGLLRPGLRALEVGCGAGRFLRALAAEAEVVVGVEISSAMASEAARRLAGAPNAAVVSGSGRDLAFVADASIDLVLYADSFPYVVQAGGDLPLRLLRETARVLRAGGHAAVLNWSYRNDPDLDACERADLAGRCGFEERPCDPRPFLMWDATVAILRRRPRSAS